MRVPVLSSSSAVPLPAVFEPIADLRRCQTGGLRQLALLGRVGVRILKVPLAEEGSGPLLEAVGLLLPVPDGPRQRELFPHAVLVHRTQRSSAELLRFLVVRFQPHGLQISSNQSN